VRRAAAAALVRSLERDELLRALARANVLLRREGGEVGELAASVAPQLHALTASWK
jgi:hypothetical protein